ncbi:MAG TPA: CHRD domain-containing protein [Streptosporangiaceae bacterium]|nr:CHRD domain-containing protein [Streptosporangiaceae bacterium]
MLNTRLISSAVLLAALGTGVAACTPGASSAAPGPAQPGMTASPTPTMAGGIGTGAGSGPGTGSAVTTVSGPGGQGIMTGPGAYQLSPMPAGAVSLTRDGHGHLAAHVRMFGLTPGSTHTVAIDGPGARWAAAQFPMLTADATGQVDTTLTSTGRLTWLPRFSRFVIRLGSDGSALAMEPIAESGVLAEHPRGDTTPFQAVTGNPGGTVTGQPRGQATISYDAAAQTLTIMVSATGLNPGPHAAHIHLGSCASQGPVKYMMPDFIADASGDIDHQTRVVTGVPSGPGPGNWYLNLHMGGMNQILANGAPTLSFRPLLCTNVSSVAGMGAATTTSPAPTATPSMTGPATPSMPAMTGTPTSTATPGGPDSMPSTMPSGDPSATPVSYPTHF